MGAASNIFDCIFKTVSAMYFIQWEDSISSSVTTIVASFPGIH